MLNDLLISGFRALKRLEISKLGRLNLITGQNNSGKSCLLEALRLWASGGSPVVMADLVQARDEIASSDSPQALAVLNLFHGRIGLDDIEKSPRIEIGPNANRLIMEPCWWDTNLKDFTGAGRGVPALKIIYAQQNTLIVLNQSLKDLHNSYLGESLAVFVGPHGLSSLKVEQLWEHLVLTDLEDEVIGGLQLVAPEVDRVSTRASASRPNRIPFVRVRNASRPIPLRSLGDGINRLFGIALAIVNARDGLMLVDEVENGIHYSAQPQLWDFIAKLARRFNVQVFATTHSWDCIKAFQQATSHAEAEGALIRLAWKNGTVRAVEYSEDELAVATQQSIEVR